MKILQRFHPKHPCKEGTACLVRASCRISFWRRDEVCEIYQEYLKNSENFRTIDSFIDKVIFHMIFWPVSIWLIGTFIIGFVLQSLYIWSFIKGFFS